MFRISSKCLPLVTCLPFVSVEGFLWDGGLSPYVSHLFQIGLCARGLLAMEDFAFVCVFVPHLCLPLASLSMRRGLTEGFESDSHLSLVSPSFTFGPWVSQVIPMPGASWTKDSGFRDLSPTPWSGTLLFSSFLPTCLCAAFLRLISEVSLHGFHNHG